MAFDVGAIVGRLEMNLKGWDSAVEKVKKDQQGLTGFAMRHSDEIKKLGMAFTAVGGAITAALGAAVVKTANLGDQLDDLRQRTGVSTELLSGYKLAADNSGTSIEGVANALKFLSTNMVDANGGVESARLKFEALGITVTNADGSLRDSNQVFLDVAERFKSMEDGAQKTALAVDLFGRSGMEMIPMLNMGRDGLRETYENAERFGSIVSQQAAKAADDFNDSLGNMKASLAGAGMELGQVMMPIVKDAVEGITGIVVKVREWAEAHPGLFSALTTLAGALGAAMLVVGPLLLALPSLVEGFTILKTALSNINPVTALTSAALGVLLIKILEYKKILDDLKGQVEKNTEIDKNWSDNQERSALVLADAAVQAGWLSGKMADLIDKYEGNTAALQADIREGKIAGITKDDLAKAGDRVNDMLVRQKGAFNGLTPTIAATNTNAGNFRNTVKAIVELIPTAVGKVLEIDWRVETLGETMLEASDKGKTLWDTVANLPDPRLDTGGFKQDGDDLQTSFAETTMTLGDYWRQTLDALKSDWSDQFVAFFKGDQSLVTTINRIFKSLRERLLETLAQMLVDYLVSFIAPTVTATTTAATTIGATIGGVATALTTVLGSMITLIATGITTIAGAIAGAIVILAEGIAAAATALAAAAPALLTVGAIAVAIYAGFAAVEALLGDGSGGAGDGMGRVVERLDDFLAGWHWWYIDMAAMTGFIQSQNDHRADQLDNLANCVNGQGESIYGRIGEIGNQISDAVNSVRYTLEGLGGAAEGAVSTSTQLMWIHGTQAAPEYIIPHTELGRFVAGIKVPSIAAAPAGGGAGGNSLTVNLNGPLVQASGMSQAELEDAGETLWKIIGREAKRNGMELANA